MARAPAPHNTPQTHATRLPSPSIGCVATVFGGVPDLPRRRASSCGFPIGRLKRIHAVAKSFVPTAAGAGSRNDSGCPSFGVVNASAVHQARPRSAAAAPASSPPSASAPATGASKASTAASASSATAASASTPPTPSSPSSTSAARASPSTCRDDFHPQADRSSNFRASLIGPGERIVPVCITSTPEIRLLTKSATLPELVDVSGQVGDGRVDGVNPLGMKLEGGCA